MRAARAVVDHFKSVPSVMRIGKLEAAGMAVSPNFWKGVAKELLTADGDRTGSHGLNMRLAMPPRRERNRGPSVREKAQARHESRIEAAGGDHDVTPRGGRMSGGGDD